MARATISETNMDPFTPGYGEFQGIPKRTVSDDVVAYSIFLPHEKESANSKLEEIKRAGEALLVKYAEGYIWQKDAFQLELSTSKKDGFPFLKGETEFGDAIDDEWFIVYMLRELSLQFPEAWIRVIDADGEFLLVEAANALPKWLDPDIATNRVWIHKGMLLIVPLPHEQRLSGGRGGISRSLSLKEAMDTVRRYRDDKRALLHIRMVEEEAFFRLSKYPKAAQEHMHNALVRIPIKVAMLLKENPSLVSRAVEAFYLRDAASLKKCEGMPDFLPHTSVKVSVKFSKVLYAQLKGQEFHPSPKLGFIPPEESSPSFSAWDVGMKLAIGFQIIMKDKLYTELAEELNEMLARLKEPTKAELASWPKTQDDESWLDVDFADFDKNLKGDFSSSAFEEMMGGNLKRMVENFEKFLNEEEVGKEGLFDDSTEDEDEYDEVDSDEEGGAEDKDASFDEAEFERMMREMMGFPPEDKPETSVGPSRVEALSDSESEAEAIKKHMAAVESELREAGAIGGEDEDKAADVEFVKNMLESFKNQEGRPGPAGNLLAQMGIVLPKDDDKDST